MTISRFLAAALVAGSLVTVSAAEAGPWQHSHPWRAADNGRLANQNYRIRQGVRDGQITPGQARAFHDDDRAIRAEERADASVNGTHLTPQDQRAITAQENANSRAIFDARHQ